MLRLGESCHSKLRQGQQQNCLDCAKDGHDLGPMSRSVVFTLVGCLRNRAVGITLVAARSGSSAQRGVPTNIQRETYMLHVCLGFQRSESKHSGVNFQHSLQSFITITPTAISSYVYHAVALPFTNQVGATGRGGPLGWRQSGKYHHRSSKVLGSTPIKAREKNKKGQTGKKKEPKKKKKINKQATPKERKKNNQSKLPSKCKFLPPGIRCFFCYLTCDAQVLDSL